MKRFAKPFLKFVGLAFPVICCFMPSVFPGGPLIVCDSGRPMIWPAGGINIPFNPDQGNLGPLDHPDAVLFVQNAFDQWGNVATATASYSNQGELPVDVDITNFFDYLFAPAPDGLSAVVFDDTGAIFDLLFGPGSGVLGFASPEWVDFGTCEVLEGLAFLNGPTFTDGSVALDIMVHEFGHYTGLAHTVVNGQIFIGDTSGPTPDNTFGFPLLTDLETMYPFYFDPAFGTSSLHADDIAILSTLYPVPDFFANSGNIAGVILASDGTTRLTGGNVIARNLADPFADAVSAISGDFSLFQGDPFSGVYTINGLSPGSQYAVFIDQILAGGFSTPPLSPLPGPEEFYNGANESSGALVDDDPTEYAPVVPAVGIPVVGIDIIFNVPKPGDPLPVGLDGFVELFLPFSFEICGEDYNSVFVNANGNLTFGINDFDWTESAGEFLAGPPRIAGLWRDLNNLAGGTVTFEQTAKTFTVKWIDVPAFPAEGSNSFEITLNRQKNHVDMTYGLVTSPNGLAGISCGGAITSGFETADDLSNYGNSRINLHVKPAVFELFDSGDSIDLAPGTVRYTGTTNYNDRWAEPNDTVREARNTKIPFDTFAVQQFSEIEPEGSDVDYYRFQLEAGDNLIARIVSGQLDTLIGVFKLEGKGRNQTGILYALDDDGGTGLLSHLVFEVPESGEYALAVTTFPDFDFVGDGFGGGRYVLDLFVADLPAVEGTVYAVNGSDSRIVQLNVENRLPVKSLPTPEPASGGPDGLSQMNGSLFFVNGFGSNTIYELSSSDGAVLNSFPAPVVVDGTDGLAASGGYLYSLDFSADTISKIDPTTGALVSSCVTGLGAVGGLAGGDGRLFATVNFVQIAELDPGTCALVRPLIPVPDSATGLAFNGEVLFAGEFAIHAIDPETGIALGSFFPGFSASGLGSSGEAVPPPPTLQSGDLLGSTGSAGGAFIQIDPASGAGVFFAPHGAFGPVTEIEFRDDGILFGSTGGGSSSIIQIDTVTGAETLVGFHDPGAVNALEFVGGDLYGTYIPGPGASSDLVIVDQNTGALTFIGPTGLGPVRGLAYDLGTALLYGTASGLLGDDLITIDLATGSAAIVGSIGFDIVSGLEFGPDGLLYGGTGIDGSLIVIDPGTGAGVPIGLTGFPAISGLGFVP